MTLPAFGTRARVRSGARAIALVLASSVLPLSACDDSTSVELPLPDAGPDAAAPLPNVTLRFRAQAGDVEARCGERLPGFGPEGEDEAELVDLRFYVHDVALRDADGAWVPVSIADEPPFQALGVTLIDLEDGTGACDNGTAQVRDHVAGYVPEGEYSAVRFTVGVPFELNHMDVTSAPSPLNLTRLYWNWRGGYIFFRGDLRTVPEGGGEAAGFQVHVGSTGCVSEDAATAPEDECVNPNRATITLDGFDPAESVVAVDLAALLEGVDLTYNTPDTGLGCMAAPNDPDCLVPMTRLGLPFGDAEPDMRAFRLERSAEVR